jgi:uncharacterized protein YkwD
MSGRSPQTIGPDALRPRRGAPIPTVMPGCPAAIASAAIALVCAAPLAGTASAGSDARAPKPTKPMTVAQLERALLAEMNRVRTARNRRALRPLATLRRPARAQSRYLLRAGELSHDSRDGSPFWTRLVAAGFPRNRLMGENLAMVSGCRRTTARRTVAMWMASPGHRANLLNPRFRWVGPGVAIGRGCSATYLTADYGG